ncbi:MAG: hypothetical protein KDE63_05200 [Novosphingobium sp.]|nr:hypothetical protein [Novosphingobium sp.]
MTVWPGAVKVALLIAILFTLLSLAQDNALAPDDHTGKAKEKQPPA